MGDWIEFHFGDRILLSLESSHAPDRGDLVNMRSVTYRVIGRTYTIDHADRPRERKTVCVINLELAP
jgi:hypothetical protein